ncbi:MAG: hypothetical protein IJ730_05705 [Alphaproteobacteria bacterium]|nr:hypothetical protein [Alphaproteobacteria bacterium]
MPKISAKISFLFLVSSATPIESCGKIKAYFIEIAFNPHIRGKLTRFSSVHDLENFGVFGEHFYALENVQIRLN